MLERIVNPNKPMLSLIDIQRARDDFEHMSPEAHPKLMERLKPMNQAFLKERGDLNAWPLDVLDDIDECFLQAFASDTQPADYLFYVNSTKALEQFQDYCENVEQVLLRNKKRLPKFVVEYFTYYSIWRMQGYDFPVPLPTRSVISCLTTILDAVETGFIEVSRFPTLAVLCRLAGLYVYLTYGVGVRFMAKPRCGHGHCAACSTALR